MNLAPTGSGPSDGNTETSSTSSAVKREPAAKRWCFTWNNFDNAPGLQKNLEKISVKFVFQEEVGEQGTRHLQGAVWFKNKLRLSALKKLGKGIHWEKMRNEEASLNYCQKSETSVGEPVKFGFPVEIETIKELRSWQVELNELLEEKPDNRTIRWIYDKDGCAGKTEFVRWYALKNQKTSICANAGNGKDVANLLKNWCETNDPGMLRCFLYNMARDSVISYRMLECMKDGMMTNTKYEATTLIFNRPHVVVMSNELPELSALSMDRWAIFQIIDGELYHWPS